MPVICVNKKTGLVVPDFQSNAKIDGTLINNAVSAGWGLKSDFEEVEVSQMEFENHIASYTNSVKAQVDQEKQDQVDLQNSVKTKLASVGLTNEEVSYILSR